MEMSRLWSQLDPHTQEWLIAHDGEPVTPAIRSVLNAANGYPLALADDDGEGPVLPDDAVDWVESIANAEQPDDEDGSAPV